MIKAKGYNPFSKLNILLAIVSGTVGYILSDWIFYSTQGSRVLFWLHKLLGWDSNVYWFIDKIWGWPFK